MYNNYSIVESYLVGGVDPKTGKHTVLGNFDESMYKEMYSQLLTNRKLLDSVKNWGYDLCFMSHPNMAECTTLLNIDSTVKVINNEDVVYRKIFAESNLIVTDYSSVVFDFAYLNKPVYTIRQIRKNFFRADILMTKGISIMKQMDL